MLVPAAAAAAGRSAAAAGGLVAGVSCVGEVRSS